MNIANGRRATLPAGSGLTSSTRLRSQAERWGNLPEKKNTTICTQEQFDQFASIHERLTGVILRRQSGITGHNEFEQTKLIEDIKEFWDAIKHIAEHFGVELQSDLCLIREVIYGD